MRESIHSKIVSVNGLETHYLTGGQGEPLIIIHGGTNGARAWRKNIAVLSKKYTIFVPDLPGFGLSQPVKGSYYIPEMVEFINQFADVLGLRRFYLIGHSLGGGVALHYTLKYPEKIRKLVLVSSLCLGREIAWWVRLFSFPLLSRLIGKGLLFLVKVIKKVARLFGPWEIVEPISKTSVQIGSYIANLTEQTIVLLSQLPRIMVPTLVIWGAKDPVVPSAQAYTAAELIPDCRVKIFDNCGHSVYRERLKEFSVVLSHFLD